jgi:(E)-4-hydroxy-3-methylbut-2-enyl-diphosphate synthase
VARSHASGPGEADGVDVGPWCGPNFVNLKCGPADIGAFGYCEILATLRRELDLLITTRAVR